MNPVQTSDRFLDMCQSWTRPAPLKSLTQMISAAALLGVVHWWCSPKASFKPKTALSKASNS